MIDLRSDTVTLPTDAQRKAMYDAELGDDCYGEDPTINRLQELACEITGMDAALFVPTGSMANQIAVKVLSSPGAEVICEEDCHLIHHEAGGIAILSNVQLRPLASRWGIMDAADVRAALRPPDPFQPRSALVAIENTHNFKGGTVWSVEDVAAVRAAGELPVFIDGARLFNAVVASGTPARAYCAHSDVVTLSLYKGLCAPMGSLVCCRADLLDEVWRFRRVFGGALRQGGIAAAAGIVGLESMIDRLAEDHENAKRLAAGIADVAPVDLDRVQTNMVVVATDDSAKLLGALRAEGVLAGPLSQTSIRLVTHKDVDTAGIDAAVAAFRTVLSRA
jgi:threonine aldolase